MTANEMRSLRNNAMSPNLWKQESASRVMVKVRREMGESVWVKLQEELAESKASKDVARWHSVLSPYIKSLTED